MVPISYFKFSFLIMRNNKHDFIKSQKGVLLFIYILQTNSSFNTISLGNILWKLQTRFKLVLGEEKEKETLS